MAKQTKSSSKSSGKGKSPQKKGVVTHKKAYQPTTDRTTTPPKKSGAKK